MNKTDRNRTIALAAMFQTCSMVRSLAYQGQADQDSAKVLIESIFNNEADSIDDIYQGLGILTPGFELVTGMLQNPGQGPESMEISRYAINLMNLQNQLEKKPKIGEKLLEGINETKRQRDYFDDLMNRNIIAKLADVYQTTISTLGPKIMIQGEQAHLSNPDIAAQIRALLLAGIRAAVLWNQAGGGRLKLLLRRRNMINEAQKLLQQFSLVE